MATCSYFFLLKEDSSPCGSSPKNVLWIFSEQKCGVSPTIMQISRWQGWKRIPIIASKWQVLLKEVFIDSLYFSVSIRFWFCFWLCIIFRCLGVFISEETDASETVRPRSESRDITELAGRAERPDVRFHLTMQDASPHEIKRTV